MHIDRIKALSQETGRSLRYLSKKLGVSSAYFYDAERYNRNIPPDRLQVIADLLQTTPEYLRGETDIKEKASAHVDEGRTIREEQQKLNSIVEQLSLPDVLALLRYAQALHAQDQANARAQKRKDGDKGK